MLPGLVLCAIGAGMSGLALCQPAWLGGQVGPGLMAQLLPLVMGIFGLVEIIRAMETSGRPETIRGVRWPWPSRADLLARRRYGAADRSGKRDLSCSDRGGVDMEDEEDFSALSQCRASQVETIATAIRTLEIGLPIGGAL